MFSEMIRNGLLYYLGDNTKNMASSNVRAKVSVKDQKKCLNPSPNLSQKSFIG